MPSQRERGRLRIVTIIPVLFGATGLVVAYWSWGVRSLVSPTMGVVTGSLAVLHGL